MKQFSLAVLLFVSTIINAQTLQEYFFNNNLNGTNGASALTQNLSCGAASGSFGTDSIITNNGLCSVANSFCFNEGGGFTYPNSTITGQYTINLFFKFTAALNGYSRVIDFSNSAADAGFYLLNSCLNFYPNGNVGTCPYFQPGIYYLFTFVRDGSSNVISVYVNGTLFGTYTDTGNLYKPATTSTPIIFFRDDNTVPCEDRAGCIKYASVSPQMLSALQVDSIWNNICSISLPPCTASISYNGSPYLTTLSGSQSVSFSGTQGGVFSSTNGLTIDTLTGAITPSTSTPGNYVVTYTVASSGTCTGVTATANLTIQAPFTSNCSPNGNMIVFTNYDGGILNIDVDQNIPNLKIGVVSYENCIVNITGTYASNVSKLVYAGFEGTNNNCNLATPISAVTINGVPSANYTINQFPPVTLANANGNQYYIICAYSCNTTTNQGGCNTIDQILDYFNHQLGGTLYSLNAQYCCWLNSNTYHVSALSNSCCNSSTASATISYAGTPYCSTDATDKGVTLTGTTGGTYSASPVGLSIDAITGVVHPASSSVGNYTVTYSVPGCSTFTTTASVAITAAPVVTISYASTSFCTGAALQTVTQTGPTGGRYTVNANGLAIDSLTGTIDPAGSSAGNYVVTYTTANSGGCSQGSGNASVSIAAVITTSLSASICHGASYTFGSQTVDTAGTYTRTLSTSSGCDSLVTLSLALYPAPVASITATDTLFCAGDSAQICVTQSFTSYAWNVNSANNCVYAKNAGNYYVTVTDANNCSVQSNRVAISIYPVPSVSVGINGDTLSAFNSVGYQWYLDGNIISGAQGSVHIATVSGSYQVEVTDSNGCKARSSAIPVTITVTDIDKLTTDGIEIFPNPIQNNSIHINATANWIGSAIEVTNNAGQVVYKGELHEAHSLIELKVAQGVYYLRINSGMGNVVRRVVHL